MDVGKIDEQAASEEKRRRRVGALVRGLGVGSDLRQGVADHHKKGGRGVPPSRRLAHQEQIF